MLFQQLPSDTILATVIKHNESIAAEIRKNALTGRIKKTNKKDLTCRKFTRRVGTSASHW